MIVTYLHDLNIYITLSVRKLSGCHYPQGDVPSGRYLGLAYFTLSG